MTTLLVPVKHRGLAKSRLSPVLSPQERASLVTRMLERTLCVAQESGAFNRTIVVSPEAALPVPDYVDRVFDSGRGLNVALKLALATVAGPVLILPGDLPTLCVDAIRLLILGLRTDDPTLVITPDHLRVGTNALGMTEPRLVPPSFGSNSFAAHCAHARRKGATVRVVEHPALLNDLDTPADLEHYGAGLTVLNHKG